MDGYRGAVQRSEVERRRYPCACSQRMEAIARLGKEGFLPRSHAELDCKRERELCSNRGVVSSAVLREGIRLVHACRVSYGLVWRNLKKVVVREGGRGGGSRGGDGSSTGFVD